jgi:hypothetical protein
MDRDIRLTGVFRAQSDNPKAPLGFEVNNPWKVFHEAIAQQISILIDVADGGPHFLSWPTKPWFDTAKTCTYFAMMPA